MTMTRLAYLFLTMFVAFGAVVAFQRPATTRNNLSSRRNNKPLAAFIEDGGSISGAVETFFKTQPYVSAFLTCSVKASAADLVAQSSSNKQQQDDEQQQLDESSSLDVNRNLGFVLYGGLYQGMAQQFIFCSLYPSWFGYEQTAPIIVMELALDMLFFGPCLCIPLAYISQAMFAGESFANGIDKYFDDIKNKGILTKFWLLWVPVKFLTFTVIPLHFQVAFMAIVSFFWVCLLSTVSGNPEEGENKLTTAAETTTATTKSLEQPSFQGEKWGVVKQQPAETTQSFS